jgi:hypothetical protein
MLELLPLFFAGVAILVIGLGAILSALAKKRLLRFFAGGSPRVRWLSIVQVVTAEVLILGCSIFVLLQRMSSSFPAFQGNGMWFLGVLFGGSTILYWVFGVIPNLYILGKTANEARGNREEFQRLGYAALLALPTPLFSFAVATAIYLSAQ